MAKYPGLLKRGSTGRGVRELQKRLLELGYRTMGPRNKELTVDGDFDGITEEAVIEFQMQNLDPRGNLLGVDGKVGPATWEALFDEPEIAIVRPEPRRDRKSQFMATALEIALAEEGIREVPINSNRGPRVEEYLASVGLDGGYSWCAAFAYWCIREAAERANRREVPFIKTAWTPSIWTWAKKQESFVHPDEVIDSKKQVDPGSLFLLRGTVNGTARVKHVGFVVSADGPMINTVEGNTNKRGSREGGGVYQLTRKVGSIYRFVTYG